MRVLVVTAMYPTQEKPASGIFVKEQVDSLKAAGVDVDVYAFDGNRSAMNYLKAALALRRILDKKNYDLIHAHYGLTGASAVMQTACPVIITYHGSDLLGEVGAKNSYTLAGRVKALISKGAGFIAAERIVVADLLKPRLWPKSSVTIPMGVDLSLFRPMSRIEARERLGCLHKDQLVLYAAHPRNPVKRYDIARQAVDLLQKDGINVNLLPVFGIPHDQMPLYMNACDVLVLTSMHEASPCVIKEAMACNLPVVSVNVGDVAEHIEGVRGCYLSERTPRDVASKLRLVLQSGYRPDSRHKMTGLGLGNIARRVIDVYTRVAHAGAPSPVALGGGFEK